jgi:NAD(P)H dehydrogenase (quinone)
LFSLLSVEKGDTVIVVTGATGKLGNLVVQSLLKRVSADQVGVSVRDPEKAAAFRERGVRVRTGDFAKPETLTDAFDGASRLLMISSNAAAFGGDPLAQHRAAIEKARQVGVERIFYTSHMASSHTSAFAPMTTHAATEELLADSGVPWTSLRNGFYADAASRFMGVEWQSGRIVAPADGKVAWTAHEDLADAAAAILTGTAVFDGPTPPLAGTEALDLEGLAAVGAKLLGHPIQRQIVEDEVFYQTLVGRRLPPHVAKLTLGFFEASRRGEFSTEDAILKRVIGRQPTRISSILESSIRPGA